MMKKKSAFGLAVVLVILLMGMMGAMAQPLPLQESNVLDGSKIERISIEWLTQDSTRTANGQPTPQTELDAVDHLYLSAATDTDLSMVYRITADFSGQYDYAPGDITITIPGKVWHSRAYEEQDGLALGKEDEGKYQGTLELPVPQAPSTKADFNWQIINGQYVLTNTRTINATSSVSIDVAISGLRAMDVVDMSECDPITAHCEVVTNQGNTIELTSKPITAQIDTRSEITSVYKNGEMFETAPDLSAKLLARLPEGTTADDYVFVRWYSYPTVQASQPYSLQIADVLSKAYERVSDENGAQTTREVCDGIFLGSTNCEGSMPGSDGADFSATVVQRGTKSGMMYAASVEMWSAYPRDVFYVPEGHEPQRVYYFDNTAQWTLTEVDAAVEHTGFGKPEDLRETGSRSDRATVEYSPIRFRFPDGHFKVYKWTGDRPHKDQVYGYALNQLEQHKDADMVFAVATIGYGYPWTLRQTKDSSYEELNDPQASDLDGAGLTKDQFGALGWKQVTYDTQTFFNFDDEPLTAQDFAFKSLRISQPTRMVYEKHSNGNWGYQVSKDLPAPDLTVEYQVNNEEEWLHAATAVWANGQLRFENVAQGVTASGMTLFFPENTTDVRHWFVSNVYGGKTQEHCELAAIEWKVYPTVTLKSSPRVRGIVEQLFEESDNPSTKFKNDVGMDVYGWVEEDGTGELVVGDDFDASRATLEGARYGVSMKSSQAYQSDVDNQQILLTYTSVVTEQSNLTNARDYADAVQAGVIPAETAGVWYNLLPERVIPLPDTVKLRDADTISQVYTIDNYKGTGRTLLVVEAQLAPKPVLNTGLGYADLPIITFDAVYSWKDLDEYGAELTNYAVFESMTEGLNNDMLGSIPKQQGEPDDPTAGYNAATPTLPESIVHALTDLDPAVDENRFLYGKTSTSISALYYTVSSLEKLVRSDFGGTWTQGLAGQVQATVFEGQSYTYRLRVASAEKTSTKGIVIYDSLENYRLPDPESDEDADITKAEDFRHTQQRRQWTGAWENRGQWRGTLESADLSDFAQAGAAPVLLYSTLPNLQFAELDETGSTDIVTAGNYDITNRNIWQVAQLDENSCWQVPAGVNVTAVALDVSKKADGTDFVLVPKQSLSGYLKMRAPDDGTNPDVWLAKGAYARVTDDEGNPVPDADGNQQINWKAAMDPANNMYAYNNTRMRLIQGHTNEESGVTDWQTHYRMIRNDYTRVGIVPGILSLEKVWKDQDDHDGKRPQSVTVSVLRRAAGQPGAAEPVLDAQGSPVKVVLNEENGWKTELIQFPVADSQGRNWLYTFDEEPVEGYQAVTSFLGIDRYTLTNVHPNEQVVLEGEKTWADDGDAAGVRPQAIVLRLHRDGEQIAETTVQPNADGAWKYSFGSMDRYAEGGREYVYTIEEEYVPKYVFEADGHHQLNNTYVPIGALEVSKTVLNATPAAAEKTFVFTLVLLAEQTDADAPAMPLMGQYPYQILEKDGDGWKQLSAGSISNGGTFQLMDGQKLLVTDLPSETTYEVVETPSAGFTSTAVDAQGAIRAGQTAHAAFTNEYRTAGAMQLSLNKKLTGRVISKNQFRFELVDKNPNSPTCGQVIRTARVNEADEGRITGGSGEAQIESLTDALFGQVEFTQADDGKTFYYQVREVDNSKPGYTSDARVYDVEVKVEDKGDGTMTVTPAFTGVQGDVSDLAFENSYTASGQLTLKAWKTLEGRQLQPDEFTFELYRYDAQNGGFGALVSTAANDAEGVITFDKLWFNQDHVSINGDQPAQYQYLMREKQGGDASVAYSDQEYVFTVTVYDNGNGTLSFDQGVQQYIRTYSDCTVCEGAGKDAQNQTCENCKGEGVIPGALTSGADDVMPVFANRLNPGALSVSKQVSAQGGNADEHFTFHVKLSNQVNELDYGMNGATPTPAPTPAPTAAPTAEPTPKPTPEPTPAFVRTTPAPTKQPIPVSTVRPTVQPIVQPTLRVTPKPITCPTVAPTKQPVVDSSKWYTASDDELKGQAYAALKNGELVFFRSESTQLTDPWGNTYNFDSRKPRQKNSSTGIIYYYVEEQSSINEGFRPWNEDYSSVKSIRFEDAVRPVDGTHFFSGMSKVGIEFDLAKLDTSAMTDMSSMFSGCRATTSLDLSTFNTSNVTDMDNMFSRCSALTSLDLSSFDTSSVTNMNKMFYGCDALTSVDLSSFDTGNVTNMSSMFDDSLNLTTLDLSTFDTSKVTTMNSMFNRCFDLTSLDLSTFNTSSVTSMYSMFKSCSSLTSLDVSSFDTSGLTDMSFMFDGCSSLTSLDVSSFDTSSVTIMKEMFSSCKSLASLDVSSFDTGSVTDMSSMFSLSSGLTSLDLSSFDTSSVTNMGSMFNSCSSLTNLDVRSFDTSSVTNMGSMFRDCKKLTSLDLSTLDTGKVTSMSYMFGACSSLTNLDLSTLDTSSVTDMGYMFRDCAGLTSLDLGTFDTSSVTDMGSMFNGCSGLASLNLCSFDTSSVTDMSSMFYKCSGLASLNLCSFDTSSVTDMSSMFYNCSGLTSLDVSSFDTGNVTDMSSMFYNCSGLTSLDLSSFDTSKVTTMRSMFKSCKKLPSLDLRAFITSSVTDMKEMFSSCSALTSLDLRGFDTSSVTSMYAVFFNCSGLTSLYVSSFDTSLVTNMWYMFYNCSGLTSLDVSSFDTSSVTNMNSMFSGCSGLTSLDVSSFDTSSATNMSGMFGGCSGLTSLDVSSFDTGNVTTMQSMFSGCSGLTSLDLSTFDTGNVSNMDHMFYNCSGLTSLDLSMFHTEKLKYMRNMFSDCTNLATLDIRMFDTGNVTDMNYLFTRSPSLHTISIGNATKLEQYEYPATNTTPPYNGMWINVPDEDRMLTGKQLFLTGNNAGTWTRYKQRYQLIFHPGEGSGSMQSVYVQLGQEYSFVPLFFRFGYDLTGFEDDGGAFYPYADGMVTIPANNNYADQQQVTLTAQWQKRDVTVSPTGDTVTFTLKAGETFTLNNLPAGTAYEVWEEMPEGWVLKAKTGDTGEIGALETSEAVFTNEYDPARATAALRASKLLDGMPAEAGAFTFTLKKGSEVLQTVQNTAGGGVVFDLLTYTEEGEHVYTICETAGSDGAINYDTASYTAEVTVTKNGESLSASVVYKDTDGIPVFQNTTKPGALSISKQIAGALTDKARQQPFAFAVTLTDELLSPWSGEVTAAYSDGTTETLTVTNGMAQVTLKGGESVTLSGIPAGLKYQVQEDVPQGWSQASASGVSGSVAAGQTASALFVNSYSVSGAVSLSISKELIGRKPVKDEFAFCLKDKDGQIIDTASNGSDGTVLFKPLRFDREGERTYFISEIPGADPTIEYSGEALEVTVAMYDEEGKGVLTPAVQWANGKKAITNSLRPGSLKVSKQVVSSNETHLEKEFVFTISLTDADGQPLNATLELSGGGTLTVDSGRAQLKLKHNQQVTILGLPHGAAYAVAEQAEPGFSTASSGSSGSITAGETAQASFTNTYSARGAYVLNVEKTLHGRAMEDGEFVFILQDEDGNELQTAAANAEGKACFAGIPFTQEDVGKPRNYRVYEKNTLLPGVTYDATVHEITLTATDNVDGTLTISDQRGGEAVTFVNRYSEKTSLSVEKRWEDGDDLLGIRPQSITAELYRDGQVYARQQLTQENGWKHTFENLDVFDEQNQPFTWQVKEAPVNGYDSRIETENGKAVIINMPQSVLKVSKSVTGGQTQKAFSFILTLTKDQSAVTDAVTLWKDDSPQTIEPDETGSITFTLRDGETVLMTGLPAGAKYTLTEKADPGYTVSATNDQGFIRHFDAQNVQAVEFVNILKTTDFTVTKQWQNGGGGPIELTLYRNGEKMDPQPAYERDGDVYTFPDLPQFDDEGRACVYSAKERYVDGFITIYDNVAPYENETRMIYNGGTIINRKEPKVSLMVTKEWRGLADGEKAPRITLTLYCNGEKMNAATPEPNSMGEYRYYDLPDTVDGRPAVYTVKEEPVDGFTTAYVTAAGQPDDCARHGGRIINTRIPRAGDKAAPMMWLLLMAASALALVGMKKTKMHTGQ